MEWKEFFVLFCVLFLKYSIVTRFLWGMFPSYMPKITLPTHQQLFLLVDLSVNNLSRSFFSFIDCKELETPDLQKDLLLVVRVIHLLISDIYLRD